MRRALARGLAALAHETLRPRLRVKLVPVVAISTAGVLAASALGAVHFFADQMLSAMTEANSTESDALRIVLEEQMKAGDRKLLHRLVQDIGREPHIAWVGVLDVEGRVQVSSRSQDVGQVIPLESPDCQVCHARAATDRNRSVTVARPGGAILRTVTPLFNRPVCQQCHGELARLCGVLVVDRRLDAIRQAVVSARGDIAAGSVVALLVLLGGLGVAFERLVIRRLGRLQTAARAFGRGDLTARAVDGSRDELGELARDFNAMADRLGQAMTSLAAERSRLEGLLNGIDDGVVVVDARLRVVTTNRAFATRLPQGSGAPAGADYAEVARAAGAAMPDGELPAVRVLRSGALEKEILVLRRPDGERVEEVYAQPLRDAAGGVGAAIEVWRDITDRKVLEAGLEHAERLATLGMLASGIAHEVGNPLASIATAVQGLLRRLDAEGGVDHAELRDYLEIVNRQVFRCHAVTERLLGFARLSDRELTPVDAAAETREVLALVAPQARSQQVEIVAELDAEVIVRAQERLVQHLLLNLVVNALRAMPAGGRLDVTARVAPPWGELRVWDTGPGLPDAVRRHLFEPLRRAGLEGGGSGLGLFLSHTLAERCSGSIALEDAAEGAHFLVRLPLADIGNSDKKSPSARTNAHEPPHRG